MPKDGNVDFLLDQPSFKYGGSAIVDDDVVFPLGNQGLVEGVDDNTTGCVVVIVFLNNSWNNADEWWKFVIIDGCCPDCYSTALLGKP